MRRHLFITNITSVWYCELGIKPSSNLRGIYSLIKSKTDAGNANLFSIQGILQESNDGGVFFCDPEFFRVFYKLEKRRTKRSGQASCLGLFTLISVDANQWTEELKQGMKGLKEIIDKNLHPGDVYCQWAETQYLVFLFNIKPEDAVIVLQRISEAYKEKHSDLKNISLIDEVQSLVPR